MTFKDFKLNEENHFVAMEYYGLILNRTFLVLLTEHHLIGIKVSGYISAEMVGPTDNEGRIANKIVKPFVTRGDLSNPHTYIRDKYIAAIENEDIFSSNIMRISKANFVIDRINIRAAYHIHRKKWGMGNYPHDGRVIIETHNRSKREFIILGNQSGKKIAGLITRQ